MHSLCFKRGQHDLLSGGYQSLNSGQIKGILSSFTKCQFACCNSTYICIPPSFTKFVKVLFINHLHHLSDHLSICLYWYFIGISTIQDDQDQNCLLILGKLWNSQISLYPEYGTANLLYPPSRLPDLNLEPLTVIV